MPTLDDAYEAFWKAVKSTVPYNPEFGIPREWRKHYQEWGAPTGPEQPLDDEEGATFQVFTHAIVRWSPTRGAEVVTE